MGTGDTRAQETHGHRRHTGTEDMGTGDPRAQVTHGHRRHMSTRDTWAQETHRHT